MTPRYSLKDSVKNCLSENEAIVAEKTAVHN